jgi:hypothetical protein
MCRFSRNLEASTSWNHKGLSRPEMGLLYLQWLNVREKTFRFPTGEDFTLAQNFQSLEKTHPPIQLVTNILSVGVKRPGREN